MAQSRQIVAIGFLTQSDLERLGQDFERAFPLDDRLVFEDLLKAIDEAEHKLLARDEQPLPSQPRPE